MSDANKDLATRAVRTRKARDLHWIIPSIAALVFLSPIPSTFSIEMTFLGIPWVFLFVYGFWLALIAISRNIGRDTSDDRPE